MISCITKDSNGLPGSTLGVTFSVTASDYWSAAAHGQRVDIFDWFTVDSPQTSHLHMGKLFVPAYKCKEKVNKSHENNSTFMNMDV